MGRDVASRQQVGEIQSVMRDKLRDCEAQMEGAYVQVSAALRQIHDEALYKADKYATFEDYCDKRWGYSRTRAYQILDHARMVDHMKKEGIEFLPVSEAVTRPLLKMRRSSKDHETFLQRATEAWQISCDKAPKQFDVPQVTGQHVEATMQHFGLHRNAKPKTDTTADDFKAWLVRGKQLVLEAHLDGYAFVEKYGRKPFPNGFRELVEFLAQCAEVAEVE